MTIDCLTIVSLIHSERKVSSLQRSYYGNGKTDLYTCIIAKLEHNANFATVSVTAREHEGPGAMDA